MQKFPPLSLYVHIPWCVQKCPYCDFNSHAQKGIIPEQEYVQHLIADLEADLEKYQASIQNRPLHSIFIGGGTPSLFSAESIKLLLAEIQRCIPFSENIEITMEANPGTVEAERFKGYVDAGVTRISMGIQSFNDDKLQRLGRIHNAAEAKSAVSLAKVSGLKSFNLDLMHGLPNQTLEEALDDLRQAIELAPPHLSWYQLTIEPNTMFAYRPPTLPDDDELWDIFEQGHHLYEEKNVEKNDRAFEFFMNRFRLLEAVPKQEFEHYTGLSQSAVKNQIDFAIQQNYIVETLDSWQVTEHGKLFLNELLALFLDE